MIRFNIICLSMLICSIANANEALWRAENSIDKFEIVPAYKSQESPFPTYVEEILPEPDEILTEQLSPEELQRMENERRAAYLLEKMRVIIEQDRIFVPDVSDVRVRGKISGREGMRVLIKKQWKRPGDKITVPASEAEKAAEMMRELKALDEDLAKIVEEDIKDRLVQAESMELLITNIDNDIVELADKKGEVFFIPITKSSW